MDESKRSHGIPFKSKLRPYVDQIRKWRRAGFTWAQITEKLDLLGCQTRATNLCQFMRRYRKRPYPSGAEPEVRELVVPSTEAAKKTRAASSKETSTPYFEQLVDEAQEAAGQAEPRPVFNVVKATRPL